MIHENEPEYLTISLTNNLIAVNIAIRLSVRAGATVSELFEYSLIRNPHGDGSQPHPKHFEDIEVRVSSLGITKNGLACYSDHVARGPVDRSYQLKNNDRVWFDRVKPPVLENLQSVTVRTWDSCLKEVLVPPGTSVGAILGALPWTKTLVAPGNSPLKVWVQREVGPDFTLQAGDQVSIEPPPELDKY